MRDERRRPNRSSPHSTDQPILDEPDGNSRRDFLVQAGAGLTALPLLGGLAEAPAAGPPDRASAAVDVVLSINGKRHALALDVRATLLDTLREELGLTGAKKGCDHGQCGACTVLVEGRRVLSCLTLAVTLGGAKVTTIEGLARGNRLHPLQEAFIKHDALQCGFCTPGQICSGVACLAEGHAKSDDEIREWMSGNICRCGAYPGIVAAIREVRDAGAR